MTKIDSPKIVKKKLFSPVWLLPIVAIILGAWLGVKSIRESGIEISIHFPSAAGIDVGKTLVKYQGLTVGKVTDVSIGDDLNGVNVKVMMDYRADPFLKENTLFWLVKPKASITGVEGLETLFSGNYIAVQPGDGKSKNQFIAQREAPTITPGHEGIVIELHANKLGSIDVGSSLFYRQIPVGSVVGYRLSGNEKVIISAFIQEQYAHLVRANSKFWNVSGLSIDASLSGVKLNTESLASLLAGGISFNTGDDETLANNGDSFTLYSDEESAIGGHNLTLLSDHAEDISVNAPIIYRGLVVGEIEDITLEATGVKLVAKFDKQYQSLIKSDSQFWISGADISLNGVKNLSRLITGNVVNILPGQSQDAIPDTFTLQPKAPDLLKAKKLPLTLVSDTHTGMSVGAQVRYKQLPIGEITSASLSTDFSRVEYQAEIYPEFTKLVTKGSFFVAEQALKLEASLEQINVQTRDLNTLISGAVSLIPSKAKALASANDTMSIYDSISEAQSLLTQQNKRKITLLSEDGASLSKNAPIYYKNMAIGKVEDIKWQSSSDNFLITLAIDKQFDQLITAKTVFWRNSAVAIDASLAGVKVDVAPLAGMINGSISLGLLDTAPDVQANEIASTQLYSNEHFALTQAKSITLTLPATAKINANSAIRYQGHKIGEVQQVKLANDLTHQIAKAYLYGEYAAHFSKQDTEFYIIDAQITLAGIKDADTLITGAYLGVLPGSSDIESIQFEAAMSARFDSQIPKDALTFTLLDKQLGSIKVGTPIFFRGIRIGLVDGYRLSDSGSDVMIFAHIEQQYSHLVNQSSRFWDASGIRLDVGIFSGAQIETGSLETLLSGGISVLTENVTTPTNRIRTTDSFTLHNKVSDTWKEWQPQQQPAQ